MSRRHKDINVTDNYKPQQAESHEDGSPRVSRSPYSAASFLLNSTTLTKRDGSKDQFSLDKIINAIVSAMHKSEIEDDGSFLGLSIKAIKDVAGAFSRNEVVIDDKYLKIPLTAFKESTTDTFNRIVNKVVAQEEEKSEANKRGAPPIKRLFKKITDSKVMQFFHKTKDTVKKKCAELVENLTQFCVCFFHGIHQAFAPDEDPYRKVSHYHDMLKAEVSDIPTRRTLSNYNNWFVNWVPVVFKETPKEKKERNRHRLWEKLIEWIYSYLLIIAPEYAVQLQRG